MVKIYVEEVIKCMMERLTKEYGLTEQQSLKEIDMCMEKMYVKWMQMEFIDMKSFEPIYEEIEKAKTTTCISER